MPLLLLRKKGGLILLSNKNVPSGKGSGYVIGTLSVTGGDGTYTYTETADPDNKFQISGSELQLSATVDWDVSTSHLVTIQADNGAGDIITQVFRITVDLVLVYFIGIGAPAATGEKGGQDDAVIIGVGAPAAAGSGVLDPVSFVIDDLGQFVIDDSANSIIVS